MAEGPKPSHLRSRAESALNTVRRDLNALSEHDVKSLVHELQVHQVELEMQNDELRRAEREAELARTQYQRLFDLAPVSYLTVSTEGHIERANRAASLLFGVEPSRLLGRRLVELVDERDQAIFHACLKPTNAGSPSSCQLRVRGPEGSTRHVHIDSNADAPGQGARLLTLTDVTERTQAAAELRALNQELEARVAERTAELSAQNRTLAAEMIARSAAEEERSRLEGRLRDAERLEGLGLLAGGIAHDFNNLLVGVLSSAELGLEDEGLSDSTREWFSMIRESARTATELTRQLLLYAGQGKVKLAPLNLASVVAECVAMLRARAPATLSLSQELPDDSRVIRADISQVRQVVTNLINNAAEAIGAAEGSVKLRTRLETLDLNGLNEFQHNEDALPGAFVILTVEDTGPGMDSKHVSRVFDPFYSTKFTGRGLGLASVRGIVQRHGGALRVRSEVGRGTFFEIAWPAATAREIQESEPPPAEVVPSPWRGSGRALVVDDELAVRDMMQRLLQRLGFEVVKAASGSEALELLQGATSAFVLAVIDRVMPVVSGDELLAELRKLNPYLPVVLVSGYSPDARVTGDPNVAFLRKPMTLAEFQGAVQGIMEQATLQ
jgi:PAS domain S-box-containing protein